MSIAPDVVLLDTDLLGEGAESLSRSCKKTLRAKVYR